MNFFRYTLTLFLVSLSVGLFAQVLKPATWSYDVSQRAVKVGDQVDLIFYVDIDQDWYLYSTDFDPDLGPMVTTFNFINTDSYELIGNIKPIGSKKKYDEIWEGEYTYFNKKAEFRQTIRILDAALDVRGDYEYQVCSDIDGKCIPFDDDFSFTSLFSLGNAGSTVSGDQVFATAESSNVVTPQDEPILEEEPEGKGSVFTQRESTDQYSLLGFMFVAFLAGLAAVVTPCVYPLIPLTVTFFTKNGKSGGKGISQALFYSFCIVLIFTLIGAIISPLMGPGLANELATNWIPNMIAFIIFVIFGLSFLGLFEITLPSRLVNKIDKQSERGGYVGIFFMALTLVVVSFSCTVPIAGSILFESAGGISLKPIVGMFGFALAFAIPFGIFAIFPSMLQKLPKSGGWLNSVKVVLGFLELAFALKFLSVADQAYHWNILDREVYIALWVVIFALMGFYLIGKIRLPNDSEMKSIPVLRLMLAIVVFSFVVYLIPGMFGAPLKSLAGFLPPMHTHDFSITEIVRRESGGAEIFYAEHDECEEPKYADFLHFPHGIQGYFDFEQAVQCARGSNKPIFIDFTGHGCVNCREMEARVWSDPQVLKRLKEDYIVVALYVDDKTLLDEADWYTSTYDGKMKKTIGKQNADFQITRFENNAQPYYVILDPDENPLTKPRAYDLNANNFLDFLDQGLVNFEENQQITLRK